MGNVRCTLQFRAPEVLENFFPVRWIVISSKIGLQFSTKYFQGCALANAVCPNQSQHLAWTRHRKPVNLETVGRVSMGNLSLKIGGKINDVDCSEWTFLRADPTSDAKSF